MNLSNLNNGETNMNDRRMHSNATAIDSAIYSDIFSTSAMRESPGLNSGASQCDLQRSG